MLMIKPPNKLPTIKVNGIVPKSIFFAGSIEMGAAEDWQKILENSLSEHKGYIFNPRRDDWDSSWEQTPENENFLGQVTWELDGLDACQIAAFYFDPKTKSPISLLELGLLANSKKIIACCPDGFWRKGNVQIVCSRYGIPLVNTLPELSEAIIQRLGAK